jgi:hypothetical protein
LETNIAGDDLMLGVPGLTPEAIGALEDGIAADEAALGALQRELSWLDFLRSLPR